MISHNNAQEPFSFDLFYTTVNAYYRTAAVKAAIQLGVFEAAGEEGKTFLQIANACDASPRGIRILCHFLTSIGFLKKAGEVFFITREMSLYLSKASPSYLGGSIDFLLSPYIMEGFKDLTSVVRTGRLTLPQQGVVDASHPQWVEFARAMGPMMSLPALLLAELADPSVDRPLHVVDVGAGHGLFGVAIARRNPTSKVTFIDWENVLAVTRENAEAAGVAGRSVFRPGDAFSTDFGESQDVVVLANFLHHFDEAACEVILRKAHRALKPGGRVLILEFIANEDRSSPPLAATFSMMMLGTTPSGEAYAYSDLERMCRAAGYPQVESRAIPPAMERVVVAVKGDG
ncbi:MAG: methyltransferase domain-containing protein [Myxococcales bacterium]|nr:MAG: methyltransferase domain-containing protein [Myxococcales bacterium]